MRRLSEISGQVVHGQGTRGILIIPARLNSSKQAGQKDAATASQARKKRASRMPVRHDDHSSTKLTEPFSAGLSGAIPVMVDEE